MESLSCGYCCELGPQRSPNLPSPVHNPGSATGWSVKLSSICLYFLQWNIFFGWLIITIKYCYFNTTNIFTLTFRSLSETFIRSLFSSSSSSCHDSGKKSVVCVDNHVINWLASTILNRESDKSTRWVKEAVHIQKEGRQSLNWDEGSYTLSHTYDRFLATSHHYRGKNQKTNWTNFFWGRSLIETETLR